MIKNQIITLILNSISELYATAVPAERVSVEHPALEEFGDYTTNIALQLSKNELKQHKQSPMEIAKKIAETISKNDKDNLFDSVTAESPGFVNFTLSLSYLHNFLNGPLLLKSALPENGQQHILIEHLSPNTNKPLHIGHVRNATLGAALLNLQYFIGKKVSSGNLNNDRGIHIIKSMYGFLRYGQKEQFLDTTEYTILIKEWLQNPNHWHTPQSLGLKSDHFVGHYYILGNNDYEQTEERESQNFPDLLSPQQQMQQMLIAWESGEDSVRALWKQNNSWFYQGMHQTLKDYQFHTPADLQKTFDREWYESQIYQFGKDIILQKLGNGVITEFDDGHVEAVLTKYNLSNIVLLRRNKTSLYITQDIELMRKRIKEDRYDLVIILTDASQNLRFEQLFAICESLEIASRDRMLHFGYGTVKLPDGKMSSRKGNVIQADQLLEDVTAKAKERINAERNNFTDQEKDQIARQVAIAAIKYGILKYNALSNITFDVEKNVAFEGDTGPYIQYTHARAVSVLSKADDRGISRHPISGRLEISELEHSLIRHLFKFNDVITDSAKSYSPNYLCEYLYILSQKFNLFYTEKPILNENNPVIQSLRLLITNRTKDTIKIGLEILGIEAPLKM